MAREEQPIVLSVLYLKPNVGGCPRILNEFLGKRVSVCCSSQVESQVENFLYVSLLQWLLCIEYLL